MRAAHQTHYGSPDVLRVRQDVDRPSPRPREVLVEVHAGTVTQGDRRLREADFPGVLSVIGRLMFGIFRPRNQTPGSSFAGRVVEVGDKVTRYSVGDEVFGSLLNGAHAEYVAVQEDGPMAIKPANLSYGEAASLPYGALTAWVLLFEVVKARRGDRVLIVGATGGVGRMAVQVAAHLGAHVTAVGSRHEALVRELGADAFIDYTKTDFTESGATWDVIFDISEGANFRRFRASLTPKGRYVTVYASVRVLVDMMLTRVLRGPRAQVGVVMGTPEQMDALRHLAEAGAVRPVIASRHGLDAIAEAHIALDEKPPGDIVLEVVPEGARSTVVPLRVARSA